MTSASRDKTRIRNAARPCGNEPSRKSPSMNEPAGSVVPPGGRTSSGSRGAGSASRCGAAQPMSARARVRVGPRRRRPTSCSPRHDVVVANRVANISTRTRTWDRTGTFWTWEARFRGKVAVAHFGGCAAPVGGGQRRGTLEASAERYETV